MPDFSLLRRAPDAVVVSHGHVDHCGALPELLKRFPSTVPYATEATIAVMDRMLHNSVSVMGTIARERGIAEYPLYDHGDVDYAIQRTNALKFNEEFVLGNEQSYASGNGGITGRFLHAGHVLGSAGIFLNTSGHILFYTGDICAEDQELMAGSVPLENCGPIDTLVIESTYGANDEADDINHREEGLRFAAAVPAVIERSGVALVPTFALGRTQEILNIIARFQEDGTIPQVPVYASGLGRALYEVYNRFTTYLHPNAELRPLAQFGRIGDVWNRDIAQALLREPCIIAATSGMMIENTPSAMIAQEMVADKRHGIFFVGYLDPNTLGYKLLHAEKGVRLRFGLDRPPVEVKNDDVAWFHFSAHAPRKTLCDIIRRIHPKNVVFVHGDPEAIDWMYEKAANSSRRFTATIGQTLTLEK